MVHPARTTRPKRCVGGKSESVTKGRGNIGIRCPPRKADWEFGETVCSTKLVNQRSCRRGCTAMLVQGFASISHKVLPQSRIAQQIRDSMSQLSRRIDFDCSAANSAAQCPMIRTEGSFTKAPAVVPRPVASISQRSIMRRGETVFVPARCTLMRCGMSEPVTKTVCSTTCSFRSGLPLTGGSANAAVVAIRAVTPATITLFTTQRYTRWLALQIVTESWTEHEKE